ncbi:hypothetical protein OY671_009529, partial [Metschnikowia pulcherrima]
RAGNRARLRAAQSGAGRCRCQDRVRHGQRRASVAARQRGGAHGADRQRHAGQPDRRQHPLFRWRRHRRADPAAVQRCAPVLAQAGHCPERAGPPRWPDHRGRQGAPPRSWRFHHRRGRGQGWSVRRAGLCQSSARGRPQGRARGAVPRGRRVPDRNEGRFHAGAVRWRAGPAIAAKGADADRDRALQGSADGNHRRARSCHGRR